ncbi:uncharacterized protein LOC135168982 isoform X1 [Diachasmimorpha longicaudata]|uniref:uncharacterized protein LOC135168982 isoform X1 n=1 Tax=Diachasmimorpha longicaudata TaxID=58733 RepID=UPI0030B8B3A7
MDNVSFTLRIFLYLFYFFFDWFLLHTYLSLLMLYASSQTLGSSSSPMSMRGGLGEGIAVGAGWGAADARGWSRRCHWMRGGCFVYTCDKSPRYWKWIYRCSCGCRF